MRRRPKWFAVVLVGVLAFAACAGNDDDATKGTASSGSSTTAAEQTGTAVGVTADSVKVGMMIVDYDCAIKDFVDFQRGDQQAIAQVFVDDINANGGVAGGRTIEPVYKKYCPIPGLEPTPLQLCTQLTEDEQVFAVLGVFIDFTGEGQKCITKDHQRIHIGHELEQRWIDEAPPGLLLTPDSTKEQRAASLLDLLRREGTLDGRTVAVLGDRDSAGRIDDVISPALDDMGVETGSTAVVSITGSDTAAAQAQLDSFLEKWKSEDVDTVLLSGLNVSAKQFVEKIRSSLPDVLLISDADSTLEQAQDVQQAGGSAPNPYDGLVSVTGQTASARWDDKNPLLQDCVETYETATGDILPGPMEQKVDRNGKTIQTDSAVTDFCGELHMFKTIADATGPDLDNANWTRTVNDLGKVALVSTSIASLCEGKYAADDGAQLVEYDPSMGESGDWKAISDLVDSSGGRCS